MGAGLQQQRQAADTLPGVFMLCARLAPLLQGLVVSRTHEPGLHPNHPVDGHIPYTGVNRTAAHSKRLA